MPGSVVSCPSCGKKYRIPEGTTAASFGCKACGADIPLAEEPAPERAGRSREAGGGGRRRRGREAPPPKSNTPVILGVVGGVIVLVILGVLLLGGGENGEEQAYEKPKKEAGGTVDPNRPKKVVETFVNYDGADKEAADEVRLFWVKENLPKKPPRPPANPDGTVKREHWEPYQEALRTWEAETRQHFKDAAAKAEVFLKDYPGSKPEMEIARAVLTAYSKADEHEKLLEIAQTFADRYGEKMAMTCHQKRGDALDKLGRYDEAADAHAEYYRSAGADYKKSARAAKKHVQALIRSGQADEARRMAAEYVTKMPRASGHLNAMVKNIALVGQRLPETPGATFLLSDDVVNWSSYQGKVTLVLLWTTQYVDGENAMREAYRLQQRLTDVPFRLVTVVFEEMATDESIDQWFQGNDISDVETVVQSGRVSQSPILNAWKLSDREKEIALKIPFTIILGKDSKVRYMDVPVGPYLEKLVRKAAR